MEQHFICHENAELCVRVLGGVPAEDIDHVQIAFAVGKDAPNFFKDVETIQRALNKVPPAEGGLNTHEKLVDDGDCGTLTRGAIERFQRKQFPKTTPDIRVDPGQRTLKRLNAILATTIYDRAHTVDMPNTIGRIRNARLRLSGLRAVVLQGNPLFPMQAERRFANWHFKIDRANDPIRQIDHVSAVYKLMENTLLMAGTPQSKFRLFTFAEKESGAVASASVGGFHLPPGQGGHIFLQADKHLGQIVLIHELGHFCGGLPGSGTEIDHFCHPLPPPHGSPRERSHHSYTDMTANEALRNVYSYQCYALPELSFSNVPDHAT